MHTRKSEHITTILVKLHWLQQNQVQDSSFSFQVPSQHGASLPGCFHQAENSHTNSQIEFHV